jgi:methylated-DNA-[protein]-cysteine S-methyltransferase
MIYKTIQSPVGQIVIASDGGELRELHVEGDRYFQKIPEDWAESTNDLFLKRVSNELNGYFNGENLHFTIPLRFEGTEFQKQVWNELIGIPPGQTINYAQLAARIGRPQAVRAVGTAVGKNPLCIVVPCHRVIASKGLGEYVAGLDRKEYLLKHERAVKKEDV